MVYYHVWDNFPAPEFNSSFYRSTDKIVTISKVTDEIVKTVAPEVDSIYLPHAVNGDIFKPLDPSVKKEIKKGLMNIDDDRFLQSHV